MGYDLAVDVFRVADAGFLGAAQHFTYASAFLVAGGDSNFDLFHVQFAESIVDQLLADAVDDALAL